MRTERYRSRQHWLPYAAAALLVVALVSLWVTASELNAWKHANVPDSGAAYVSRALDQLEAATRAGNPLSPELEEFKSLGRSVPQLGSVLLIDTSGQVLYRPMPRKAGYVSDLTTPHLSRVLAAVPSDALSAGQRLLLLAGDAILAEGEHVDIYNYAARLLVDGQGNPVGAVAVAYDRNARPVSSAYMAALPISLAALVLYWLVLPLWVFLDAQARGEHARLWAVLALVGNLLGVVTYLLMRRPARRACPACNGPLEAGWEFCPRCAANVAE